MKNYFEYKGYIGKVQFSAEDMVLYGVVYGLNDLVTFEAVNAVDLEIAFHDAVDGYLQMCLDIGKAPEKAYKGQFNIRINPILHKKLALQALKNDTTLNEEAEKAIDNYINRYEEVAVYINTMKDIIRSKEKHVQGDWIKNNPENVVLFPNTERGNTNWN